jgi:hypothetical protein
MSPLIMKHSPSQQTFKGSDLSTLSVLKKQSQLMGHSIIVPHPKPLLSTLDKEEEDMNTYK